MSTERLAKVLNVDEVSLMHGPKGMAIAVRIEKSWQGTTIDNEDIEDAHGKRRMDVVAEKLGELSDTLCKAMGRGENLRKAVARQVEDNRYVPMSWADAGGFKPWDRPSQQPLQQVQRVESAPRPQLPPPDVSPAPAVSASMPSRFHAIMAELKKL